RLIGILQTGRGGCLSARVRMQASGLDEPKDSWHKAAALQGRALFRPRKATRTAFAVGPLLRAGDHVMTPSRSRVRFSSRHTRLRQSGGGQAQSPPLFGQAAGVL